MSLDSVKNGSTSAEMLARLKNYEAIVDNYNITKRAAVLVPLIVNENDEVSVLLTLRSKFLRTHAGGKKDETDESLIHTALRESLEEIGLSSGEVKILNLLSPALAKNNILVTPVIGVVDYSFEPKPNPDEVSACFTVPLSRFLSTEGYGNMDINWLSKPFRMHKFEWDRDPDFEIFAPGQPTSDFTIKELEWALAEAGIEKPRVSKY
ncbi:Peroxisomal coenzyme A diphosphatase nudt7 [Lobulomyces angularis]|nr:Peroxisomal coenzyme A diphosphatase nudt7 [Lobulomyces angularis]